MDKLDFLMALEEALLQLPEDDRKASIEYYAELIDDRVEEGMSEAEAVESLGPVEKIAEQILMELPLATLVKNKIKSRRKRTVGELLLLILGFPVWFPVLVTVVAVIFAVYVCIWAVDICLYAVDVALWGSGLGCTVGGVVLCCTRNFPEGLFLLGAGAVCAGLALLFLPVCNLAAKGSARLGKVLVRWLKGCFIRKGDAK